MRLLVYHRQSLRTGNYSEHIILSLHEDSFLIPFLSCRGLGFSFLWQSLSIKEEEQRYLDGIVYRRMPIYVGKGPESRGGGMIGL